MKRFINKHWAWLLVCFGVFAVGVNLGRNVGKVKTVYQSPGQTYIKIVGLSNAVRMYNDAMMAPEPIVQSLDTQTQIETPQQKRWREMYRPESGENSPYARFLKDQTK